MGIVGLGVGHLARSCRSRAVNGHLSLAALLHLNLRFYASADELVRLPEEMAQQQLSDTKQQLSDVQQQLEQERRQHEALALNCGNKASIRIPSEQGLHVRAIMKDSTLYFSNCCLASFKGLKNRLNQTAKQH